MLVLWPVPPLLTHLSLNKHLLITSSFTGVRDGYCKSNTHSKCKKIKIHESYAA